MTTYGTIPTSTPVANLEYLSRAKERLRSGLGTRRPWKEMFSPRSISFPRGFGEAIGRIRTNVAYFQMNYAIVVLVILFLSLLWHPISLIVLAVMAALWIFLYFLRDEPLVVLGRTISDTVVLIVLGVLTIGLLFLTQATVNILVALLIGAVVVALHAALRRADDLFQDEEAAGAGGLLAKPGGASSSSK